MVEIVAPSIFREYDIRGIVGDTLTHETAELLGLAIASEALAHNEDKIIVARDGRNSSPELMRSFIIGARATGCEVIDIGAVPTPLLYFATHTMASTSGVMITGSHNPPQYNGFKIVIAGDTLSGKRIQALYQRIVHKDFASGKGELRQANVIEPYQQRILRDIKIAKPLKIVIDCGHGIAGDIAPGIFSALGCEVIPLYCEVDGDFPHHHPDPSDLANLQDLIAAVQARKADLGIAFDGDADRVGLVTNKGEVIWPDRLLMRLAIDVLKQNPGATIVFDVKCTSHLDEVIKQQGGRPLMWKTGHSLIKSKMRQEGALLAGEMSGHIYFADRWYGFDDGIYAALRIVEILSKINHSSSQVFSALPSNISTPEIRINVPEEKKFSLVERLKKIAQFPEARVNTIDGIRIDYPDGWGLIRASNTTPALIARFEASDIYTLERIKAAFHTEMMRVDDSLHLPF
ncbi:MAG: hypothetical protein Tsb005_04490 [Gammaproteobacteria bacterium]